ncbi:aldose epimerase family protein [Oceanomicrobium pacificus]|uniref:Aldose 1-epimerase n=1 Tax=Oceanomicrobium pacificus TaxID=2692916 RepID=A0A6B0TX54_9RHOB|nr:hypothetical protein [Oceanomicrobium pacificus]MXU65734.1 hypothetical protein [Oceanomicrobium pacificus]
MSGDGPVWQFDWDRLSGEVQALGGMAGPVHFDLGTRRIQPFAIAPWGDDPLDRRNTLPPILRRLRGEWPCVPFGMPELRTDLPDRWRAGLDPGLHPVDRWPHGFGANHLWHRLAGPSERLTIGIDYPADHAVKRLERSLSEGPDGALDIGLTVEMRRDALLPLGLHPVFRLPDEAGAGQLDIPSAVRVHSFPLPVEPGRSVLQPGQAADGLGRLALEAGGHADMSRLPLPVPTEELLLVDLTEGHVELCNISEGYRVILTWDVSLFPSCLLWVSTGGRTDYPWNGRFNAIGIEPVAAPFDLGEIMARNPDLPIASERHHRALRLTAADGLRTRYSISVSDI